MVAKLNNTEYKIVETYRVTINTTTQINTTSSSVSYSSLADITVTGNLGLASANRTYSDGNTKFSFSVAGNVGYANLGSAPFYSVSFTSSGGGRYSGILNTVPDMNNSSYYTANYTPNRVNVPIGMASYQYLTLLLWRNGNHVYWNVGVCPGTIVASKSQITLYFLQTSNGNMTGTSFSRVNISHSRVTTTNVDISWSISSTKINSTLNRYLLTTSTSKEGTYRSYPYLRYQSMTGTYILNSTVETFNTTIISDTSYTVSSQ